MPGEVDAVAVWIAVRNIRAAAVGGERLPDGGQSAVRRRPCPASSPPCACQEGDTRDDGEEDQEGRFHGDGASPRQIAKIIAIGA